MRFNILSLSGGGYMGLYTAHVLAALERRSGKPLRESFDLVAGTSVGGILGLGVALGVPMERVAELFDRSGGRIFSDRSAPRHIGHVAIDTLRFLSGAKYDNAHLTKTIAGICGQGTLMEDIPTRFIAPAVNLTRGMPHTFRTPHLSEHSNSRGLRALDVALATSAAPTLLPIVQIREEFFSDGGIYANSPDQIALHEAESLIGINPANIHLLSIGTTTGSYEFPQPKSLSFGLYEWMEDRRMIRVALATQQQSVYRILAQRLGRRYMRLDAPQGPHANELGLDIASKKARVILAELAEQTAASFPDRPGLDDFIQHRAPPPHYW